MDRKYLAFISYRHTVPDGIFAETLGRKIEYCHLPRGRELLRRTFRDRDELPTSRDLGEDIENALKNSEYLIAVCSEEYAASKWCRRELELFIKAGKKDRIFPVLISGTPENAIPERISDVPVAADLRWAVSGSGHGAKKAARDIVPHLISLMSGINEKDIVSAEKRHRTLVCAGIFAAVISVIIGIGAYASRTANLISDNNAAIAEATALTAKAQVEEKKAFDEAVLKKASYNAEQAWVEIEAENDKKAIELLLSVIPEDLNGDTPVSAEALGALRAAVSMPMKQENKYVLTHSVPFDFELKGVVMTSSKLAIVLEDGEGMAEKPVLYSDGVLDYMEGSITEEALKEGFSRSYYANSGSPRKKVFFGPEKPMEVSRTQCTLNGEPFYADNVLESGASYYMLAWLNEPVPGQGQKAALFYIMRGDAVAEIPAENGILCAAFSGIRRLCVIDGNKDLKVYDGVSGKYISQAPGKYIYADYGGKDGQLFVIRDDGTACCLDPDSYGVKFELESAAKVKQLTGCTIKNTILACCEDGIRIYGMDDGKLQFTVRTGDEPSSAYFKGYEDWTYLHDGEGFFVLFDDHGEIYDIDTLSGKDDQKVVSIYEDGLSGRIRTAFYSPDGRIIYVDYLSGNLGAWDVETGELLWKSISGWIIQGNAHINSFLDSSGKYVFRSTDEMNGLEKLDAGTGELIYTALFDMDAAPFIESPDGKLAFAKSRYGKGRVVFEPESGKILWSDKEDAGETIFSEDGKELLSICEESDTSTFTKTVKWRRIDALTGKILEEKLILEAVPDDYVRVEAGADTSKALVIDDNEDYSCERSLLCDMRTGSVTDIYPTRTYYLNCDPEGKTAVTFIDDSIEYCCLIYDDGSLGEVFREDTPEFRYLTCEKGGLYYFAGDACRISDPVNRQGVRAQRLIRISDGAVLLDAGSLCDIAATAADGTACIYGTYKTPVIVKAEDAVDLIKAAKEKLEAESYEED